MKEKILQLLANSELLKFLKQIEKIKEPIFHTASFTFEGKVWIGLLIREKEKKDET